jgi:glycerol dehydrogenase
VGVDANNDDQLQRIAARSVIPGESSHNEPFPVTAEALVAALKAADQLHDRKIPARLSCRSSPP